MSNNVKNVCDHIRNVRNSLKNAEASFRSNNDMRGELDLMLAEAEMQHLREKRGPTASWTRQKIAVFVAALLVLTGVGGWFWARNSLLPYNGITVAQDNIAAADKKIPGFTAKSESGLENIQKEAVTQDEQRVLPKASEQIGKVVLQVPENEVRNLVRTARKTLNDSN